MTEHPTHYSSHIHIHKERFSFEEFSEFTPAISDKKEEVAVMLLNAGSFLYYKNNKPFPLNSGVLSPFYIDSRLILSNPDSRHKIIEHMTDKIKKTGKPDVIAGVATAGIPYAAIIAEKLDLPMVYVRPVPKSHGMQNQVEGKIKFGQRAIFIEDQISSGGSSLSAIRALRNQGAIVNDEVSIITRGTKQSKENLIGAEIKLYSLTDLDSLIKVAKETDYLDEDQIDVIEDWLNDPENWGAKMGFKS